MKIVHKCVACGSSHLKTKSGQFAPFIAHRVCEYPLCHININGTPIFPFMFTNSLECENCGFIFSQIRFEDEELAKIYSNYRGPEYTAIRNTFEPGYANLNALIGSGESELTSRERTMTDFVKDFIDVGAMGNVLDYGGDRGQNIPSLFASANKFVYDVSNPTPVAGVSIVDDLDALEPMDFIMSCNVLEHLPYPGEALDKIKKLCRPETRIFIDVPDELRGAEGSDYDAKTSYFHEHINFFSRRSLTALIETHGFRPLKCEQIQMEFGWTTANALYLIAEPV